MEPTTINRPHPSPRPGLAPVLTRLHREWHRLRISASDLATVRDWGLPGDAVDDLDEVLVRCGYRADRDDAAVAVALAVDPSSADEHLLRLLELAPTEALAARIVLQRILPPLCAVARRHTLTPAQRRDLTDDLIANAWPIICRYPTDRRPRRIVPNLVRDITFETVVRPSRRRRSQEIPTLHSEMDDPPVIEATEPLDELVDLLRVAATVPGIASSDLEFMCQLVNHGRTEGLAATLDVTARTVRNRRDAVVHRLRTLVACAA